MQPAAPFMNSSLAQFVASRQACSEKCLTGMGLICIQNGLGTVQTLASAFVSSDSVLYCWCATEGMMAHVPT